MSDRKIPILTVDNFDLSKVSFTKPKKDDYGQRLFINYDNSPFMLKTPAVRFPFGLDKVPDKFNAGPEPKFTMPMTFSEWTDQHEETSVKKFYSLMFALEQMVIKYIAEHSKEFYGKKKSIDVIEDSFNSIFKRGVNRLLQSSSPQLAFDIIIVHHT